MAVHLFTKVLSEVELLLYMGTREKEEIEKIQKDSIRRDGIRVIGVERSGGSPLDIVEGLRHLKKGGFLIK